MRERLHDQGEHLLTLASNRVANLETRLRLLSPHQVLARGYSITTDAVSGKVIRAAVEVTAGQRLKTRLAAGEIGSVAEDK